MAGFNNWGKIAAAMPVETSKVVRTVAFQGKANVQANIQAVDAIDTGFMLGSCYTVTSDSSTYSGGPESLPAVAAPPNKFTAYYAVAAKYAPFVNYGTYKMGARPFWEPANEKTKQSLDDGMNALNAAMERAAS